MTYKRNMKWIVAILVAGVFSVSMMACSKQSAPASASASDTSSASASDTSSASTTGKKLTVWTLNYEPFYDPQVALAAQFKTETGVDVNVQQVDLFGGKAAAALSSGTGPDVIYWMGKCLYPYFLGGKLVTAPSTMTAKPSDYWPASMVWWQNGNNTYGYPDDYNYEGYVELIINNSLLTQNGFSIPADWIANGQPASFQDIVDFAKKVTVMKGKSISIPGLVGFNDSWTGNRFLSLVQQMGGNCFDDTTQKITFNTDIGQKALTYMNDMCNNEGICSFTLGLGIDQFITNNRAMMALAAPHWAGKIASEQPNMDWVAFKMPPLSGDAPYFLVDGGWGYAVLNTSKDQDDAWKFVDYCLNPDNAVKVVLSGAMIPANKSLYKSPILMNDPMGKKYYPQQMDLLQYGFSIPTWTIDNGFITDTLNEYCGKVFAGTMDIPTALKTAEDLCNSHADKLKATFK